MRKQASNPREARAKLAAAKRHHPSNDHTQLKRDLATANIRAYVQKVLATAPPLKPEDARAIADMLNGGATK